MVKICMQMGTRTSPPLCQTQTVITAPGLQHTAYLGRNRHSGTAALAQKSVVLGTRFRINYTMKSPQTSVQQHELQAEETEVASLYLYFLKCKTNAHFWQCFYYVFIYEQKLQLWISKILTF